MPAQPSRSTRAYLLSYCKRDGCEWEMNCAVLRKRREGRGNDVRPGQWPFPPDLLHNLPSGVHTMHRAHRGIGEGRQPSSGVQSPLSSLQWRPLTIHLLERHQTSPEPMQWRHRSFHLWTESYESRYRVDLPVWPLPVASVYSRWRLPPFLGKRTQSLFLFHNIPLEEHFPMPIVILLL